MKKLAIVGYGKMGRMIEQLAPQHEFDVVVRLDSKNNPAACGITAQAFSQVDAAIEFSSPGTAPANLIALAKAGIPTVTGTTGWLAELDRVRASLEQGKAGLVWAANFSVGVAIFNKLAALAAKLFNSQEEYGAWAWEIHHSAKKDAPSGTMLQMVQAMQNGGFNRSIDVSSSRAGKHPGTHEIGFDSPADTITLRHAARSREGFAHGALKSAKWIIDRQGLYTFEDVLFGEGTE